MKQTNPPVNVDDPVEFLAPPRLVTGAWLKRTPRVSAARAPLELPQAAKSPGDSENVQ
jgi:hypothetical protein